MNTQQTSNPPPAARTAAPLAGTAGASCIGKESNMLPLYPVQPMIPIAPMAPFIPLAPVASAPYSIPQTAQFPGAKVSSVAPVPVAAPAALARNTDPQTSHLAAEAMDASGAAQEHEQRIIAGVRKYPGLCADELAPRIGLKQNQVSRRLRRMALKFMLKEGRKKISTVGGREGLTWWPIDWRW